MNFKVIVYDNKENHNENSVTASCSNNGTYCVEGYNTTIYSCTSTAYTGTRQYSVQGSSCITTTT